VARSGPPGLRHPRVRVYETLRTAHLERAHEHTAASLVYVRRNYDFDASLLEGLDVHHCGSLRDLFRLLARSDVRVLEVNEPLMLSALKLSAVAVTASRLGARRRRGRVAVVSYALANSDPFASTSARLRSGARRRAFRLGTRWLTRRLDRLAYGSPAAEQEYAGLVARAPHLEDRLFPALPTACETCDRRTLETGERPHVVFLGAFDHRKGLEQVLAAWPYVADRLPDLRLRLLGKGPLVAMAQEAADRRAEVSLVVDPSREEIHRTLASARALVLLSQPSSTWREQIGLPLVEGLAHGCEIVTTSETGLAAWLAEHGHHVVDPSASAQDVADAVVAAVGADRSPADVLAHLPPVDGRRAADAWLFAAAPSGSEDR
jgi:glycosyltransferase involved in cell wall biosynthesis